MDRDARARRGDLPTVFISLVGDEAAAPVLAWVRDQQAATAVPAGA